MSPRDFFLVGMWLLALATAPALSVAETTEAKWGIKVNLLPGPTFKSFAEAEAEMKLPSTNADAPWLVQDGPETTTGSDADLVANYWIPPASGENPSDPTYQDGTGGTMYSTAQEVLDWALSQINGACSKDAQWTSAWYNVENFSSYTIDYRNYQVNYNMPNWSQELEAWVCPGTSYQTNGYVKQFYYFYCPSEEPYGGSPTHPIFATVDGEYGRWCFHPLTAKITVPRQGPNVAPPTHDEMVTCVGNPCDARTGNKFETEIDYQSNGLTFVRTYNSLWQVRHESGLGERWTHNYGQRLFFGPNVNSPIVWQRSDAKLEQLRYMGVGIFGSADGSGVELRLESGEWVLYENSGARTGFDTAGILLWLENPASQRTVLTYDDDELETITGPFGHTLQLSYTNGVLTSMTDPAGEVYQYSYANGNLTQVTYPDTTARTYHYEDNDFPQHLTGITDENSDRYATFAYDDDWGRVTLTEHAGGYEQFTLVYNSATKTTVTDALSNVTVYDDNSYGTMPTQLTRSDGYLYRWYTGYKRPSISRNAAGKLTRYYYNNNHMTSMLDSLNRTTTYQYLDNETDKPTLVRTPSVYSSQYRDVETIYNVDDLPETIEISGYTPSGTAVSRSIQLDYNSYGQITEIDGPRTDVSDVTTFDYYECTTGDGCGQLESVTNALGHETTFDSYDDNGRLLQMTSPNNVVVTYTYDLRGRVLTFAETPPSGPARTTSFAYDDAGQLETVEAPNGTELTYEYDAAHNLISITDNAGNTIEYDHDLNGNITDEDVRDSSQTLTRTVEYAYDARNRVDYINAGGSSVTALVYDAVGNLTEETDPNVNDTEHDYDAFNRLIETLDALSGATEYGYDKNDYLASVEAPNGATTTYSYDDLGNLLSFTSPDTGTTTYTYDAAGNRLTQTDANNVTVEYEYDALNRLVSIEYPDSSLDVTFSYDGGTNQKGRLTQMADGTGTTTFSYDVFGNLTQESKFIDSDTHVTAYTYDEADLLESITYPSGRTVDYTRNVLGQITEVETTYDSTTVTVVDQVTYEPFGALNGLTFGNSLAMSRDFDQRYVMTGQTAGSIQDLVYTLDSAGNIDAVDDDVDPSLDQTFTQDALHRITQDIGDYGTKSYTYDGVGNRLTRVHGANTQTLTYTSNSNRLATHDGLSVTQDSAGNTTADATQNVSFTYRDHNRMSTASVGGVLQADYRYNGHGQRVKKLEATGSSRKFIYHYGVNGELIGESVYNSGGTLIEEHDYIWLETLPLAQAEQTFSGGMLSGNTLVYIHADQLNTPRLATDGSGTVVWRWDSDGFGIGAADLDPDSDTNEVNVRLRFPGQHLDEETGLHYNYFRDYDPVTGRYVESDPIGLDGGLNTYLYANGNPLRFTDPFGLDVKVVTSDPAAAKILMDAYARLTSTRAGMLMCDSLEKSPEVYQIKPITKDAFYCPPGTTDPVCHGDERTVFIDPYNNIFLPTTAGMQETPKAVVLGHELGHARGVRDDGPNAMNNVNAHENPVRRALGLPERSAYYLTSPPVWVPGTR